MSIRTAFYREVAAGRLPHTQAAWVAFKAAHGGSN